MEKWQHTHTDEIVCPYCGTEQSDPWELDDDDGELDCDECSRIFLYSRYVEITYSTKKVEDTNVEKN